MNLNLKQYAKAFIFIYFTVSYGFTNNAIDAIKNNHAQRRILSNISLIENQEEIKTTSNAITAILSETANVSTTRHATFEEKYDILRSIIAERLLIRKTKELVNDFSIPANHYKPIRERLEMTASTNHKDAIKARHYRVLELTWDFADAYFHFRLPTFSSSPIAVQSIAKELSDLTDIDIFMFAQMAECEHHLALFEPEYLNVFKIHSRFVENPKDCTAQMIFFSIAEINTHPLNAFAQISLEMDTYQEYPTQEILDSLSSVWGELYSPYQFEAAKFLITSRHKSFWKTGIRVMNNIAYYDMGHNDTERAVFAREEISKELSLLTKEIKEKEEKEEKEGYKLRVKDIVALSRLSICSPFSHLDKQKAHDFLTTGQWDYLSTLAQNNTDLENEISLTKEICSQISLAEQAKEKREILLKQNILLRIEKSLKELLSSKKSSWFAEINLKLFHLFIINTQLHIPSAEPLHDSVTEQFHFAELIANAYGF